MLKLRNYRPAIGTKTGLVALASSAVILISPGAALANGGNWGVQIGPAGNGCYAWTNWTYNHVTAHNYSQSGDTCYISISQRWRGSGASTGFDEAYTTGSGQVASVPNNPPYNYYYYGPSGNDYLCVYVYAADDQAPPPYYATVTYGTNC